MNTTAAFPPTAFPPTASPSTSTSSPVATLPTTPTTPTTPDLSALPSSTGRLSPRQRVKAFLTRTFRSRRPSSRSPAAGSAATPAAASTASSGRSAGSPAPEPAPRRGLRIFSALRRTDPAQPRSCKRSWRGRRASAVAGAAGARGGDSDCRPPRAEAQAASSSGASSAAPTNGSCAPPNTVARPSGAAASTPAQPPGAAGGNGEETCVAGSVAVADAVDVVSYHGLADADSDLDSDDCMAAHHAGSIPVDVAKLPSFVDPRTTPKVSQRG